MTNHSYFVLMQRLKSEVEGLRKEVKRLELDNASKHAELVDSKLSEQSNLKTMYMWQSRVKIEHYSVAYFDSKHCSTVLLL